MYYAVIHLTLRDETKALKLVYCGPDYRRAAHAGELGTLWAKGRNKREAVALARSLGERAAGLQALPVYGQVQEPRRRPSDPTPAQIAHRANAIRERGFRSERMVHRPWSRETYRERVAG